MEGNDGILQRIARHLVRAIVPLRDAVSDLESFQAFMLRIGWNVESLPSEYTSLAAPVSAALNTLENFGDDAEPSEVIDLIQAVGDLYRRIDAIASARPASRLSMWVPSSRSWLAASSSC